MNNSVPDGNKRAFRYVITGLAFLVTGLYGSISYLTTDVYQDLKYDVKVNSSDIQINTLSRVIIETEVKYIKQGIDDIQMSLSKLLNDS